MRLLAVLLTLIGLSAGPLITGVGMLVDFHSGGAATASFVRTGLLLSVVGLPLALAGAALFVADVVRRKVDARWKSQPR